MEDQSLYESDGSDSGWESDDASAATPSKRALPPPLLGEGSAKRARCRRERGVQRGCAGFRRSNPRPVYAAYVLGLVTFAYVMNQMNRYLLGVVARDMEEDVGFGDRKGGGYAYEALAGPVFTVCYVCVGLPLGLYADRANRRNVLVAAAITWSLATAAMGLATRYWHLVAARAVQGIGEAGCTPVATSLLGDLFLHRFRGSALGVYQFGVYAGFSASFGLGNALKNRVGYRLTLVILSAPGLLAAAAIALTVAEPKRTSERGALLSEDASPSASVSTGYGAGAMAAAEGGVTTAAAAAAAAEPSPWEQLRRVGAFVAGSPSFILLCVASSVRNAAGVVWGNNAQQFYEAQGLSDDSIAVYMSVVPLVAGSVGAFVGGELSDRWLQRGGPSARGWVLCGSQALATPLVVGVLFAPPPWTFVLLVCANVVGEAWIAVALASAVDVLPADARVVGVSLFVFLNTVVGGFATILVTPLKDGLGSLRRALLVLYPGFYLVSAFLFAALVYALRAELGRSSGGAGTTVKMRGGAGAGSRAALLAAAGDAPQQTTALLSSE